MKTTYRCTCSSSSKEQEGENSIFDEFAVVERPKQVPFDNEKGINYTSNNAPYAQILVANLY